LPIPHDLLVFVLSFGSAEILDIVAAGYPKQSLSAELPFDHIIDLLLIISSIHFPLLPEQL
jgi:hypothetical protein